MRGAAAALVAGAIVIAAGMLRGSALAQPPPAPTVAAAPTAAAQPVIPPGQEEVLAAMLGRGVDLGGCRLASADVQAAVVRSTYACPKGPVVVALSHPSAAARGAMATAQFALTPQSGKPPKKLMDALTASIRAHEASFTWLWVGAPPTPNN